MGKAINTCCDNLGYFNPPNVYRPAIIDIRVVGEYSAEDGATNTYRITQNDGKIFEFDVKNGSGGSAGRSVTSVEQVQISTESLGKNIARINLSDGTYTDVEIRNGAQGQTGPQGERGPAGVESVNVSVAPTTGTPAVERTFQDGVLGLAFSGLKGEKGDKGDQGNTGSSVDYPYELVNNVTTDDATKGLSAAQGVVLDGKISQLGQEVDEIDEELHGIPEILISDFSGYERYDGVIVSGVFHNDGAYGQKNKYILVPIHYKGEAVVFTPNSNGTQIVMLASDNLVSGSTAPFANGWNAERTITSQTSLDVPSDCEYLMVQVIQSLTDKTPISLRFPAIDKEYYTKSDVDSLIEDVNEDIDRLDVNDVLLENSGVAVQTKIEKAINVAKIYGTSYNSSGAMGSKYKTYCRYEKFYIRPNTQYLYTGTPSSGVPYGVVYLDATGSVVGQQFPQGDTYEDAQLTIPDDAVLICASSSENDLLINEVVYPAKVEYIEKSYNLNEISLNYTPQLRINESTGNITSSSNSKVSDIILIDNTKKYRLSSHTDQYRWAVAYYSSTTVTDNTTWLGSQGLDLNGTIDLDIPYGAASMRICTLDSCSLYYKTYYDALPSDLKKTEYPLSSLVHINLVDEDGHDIGNGIDIDTSSGGGELSADKVNVVTSVEYKLDESPLTDAIVALNTGWSGNLQNGFTHASGNTAPLEFDISSLFSANDRLLVTFDTTGLTASNEIYVSAGDGDLIRSYNGGSNIIAGIVYASGKLKFTPTSNFSGTLTNIKCRKLDENGSETLTVAVDNVLCQNNNLVYGFWNVAIGGKTNTFSQMTDGTRNIAIGVQSLNAMKVGNRNVAIGTFSMPFVTQGENNVAIGADSIYPVVNAQNCVAIGKATMGGRTVTNCVAIGHLAMGEYLNTVDKSETVAIGANAGTYSRNKGTYIGFQAGHNTKGNGNTAIGNNAMVVVNSPSQEITGINNVCVGYNARVENSEVAKAASNSMALGANTTITKSNQVIIGNGSVTEVIIAGKKIIFHDDHTVTWETVS